MIIKKLIGHSGCKVLLCQDKDDSSFKYVRKISSSKKYNTRLVNQLKKQEAFSSEIEEIKTPLNFQKGYIDNLFYFDMQYINGKMISDFTNSGDIVSIDPYLKILLKYLISEENIGSGNLANSIIEKVKSMRTSITKYDKYFDYVLKNNWDNLPIKVCHGDFTLENLIISNGNIYFIDFLDSFIETNLLDMSKILFDVRYFWSKRRIKRKAIIKNMYIDSLISNTELYKKNFVTINCLIVLNILRTIPYTGERSTILYLEDCLKHAAK